MVKIAVITEEMFDEIIQLGYDVGEAHANENSSFLYIEKVQHLSIVYKKKLFDLPRIENADLDKQNETGSTL